MYFYILSCLKNQLLLNFVCVCVCVRERETETEKERERESKLIDYGN